MDLWSFLATHIANVVGKPFNVQQRQALSGGCINNAYCLQGVGQAYFIKLNRRDALPMFQAEAAALETIAASATLRVPQVVCWGQADDKAYLVLEYLSLQPAGEHTMEAMGRQLALLHRVTAERFGWQRNNSIGATPQINSWCSDWLEFWRRYRLGYQLQLAADNGYCGNLQDRGGRLLAELQALFSDYTPVPALLHGDLWSGNVAADDRGCPLVFDPAVYYGDRETDLAMSELFGGFSSRFYRAYAESYPPDQGYRIRKKLYNLYHILNHLNLFGRGYLAQAHSLLDALLAELEQ